MSGAAIVPLLQVIYLVGAGLTALKLLRSGLHRRYRVFFVYLLFLVPYTACSLLLDIRSNAYQYYWVTSAPLLWVLHVLVVLELFRLILEKHRGLYTLGRWAMSAGMAVSIVVSGLTLLPRITPAMPQHSLSGSFSVNRVIEATERGVDLALVLFLLLMLLFLGRYPVPLSRNTLVHAAVFTIFFLSTTLTMLLYGVFGLRLRTSVDIGLMGVSSACMMAWLALLSAKGEESRHSLPWINPAHEERILQQLDALNATLLKVSPK